MHSPPTFYNQRKRSLTVVFAVLSALLVLLLAVTAVAGLPAVSTVFLAVTQVFLLATTLFQLYLIRGYVQLTPEGIAVREVRLRTVPWRYIVAIRTRQFLANTVVEVRMADGRKRNLVAPNRLRAKDDARFAADVALIHHWWAYCRGW